MATRQSEQNLTLESGNLANNAAKATKEPEWGSYYPWGETGQPDATPALAVVLFVSYQMGYEVFRRALDLHRSRLIRVVGVVTDDTSDKRARISKHKRSWKYFSPSEQAILQQQIETLAKESKISCFTGNVKSDRFLQEILPQWNPSTILMYGFGQLIPPQVFNYPEFGMYNFHPSDLANQKYAGADPIGGLLRKGELSTTTAVHHVNGEFDQGKVIGERRDISLIDGCSDTWLSPKEICKSLSPIAGEMATRLLKEIVLRRTKLNQFKA